MNKDIMPDISDKQRKGMLSDFIVGSECIQGLIDKKKYPEIKKYFVNLCDDIDCVECSKKFFQLIFGKVK